jgi:hypothetical protein
MSAMDAERGSIEDAVDKGDLGRLVRKYDAQTPGFRARVIAALSAPPLTVIQRIPAEERVTFADLHADNWRSVEHEAVPDGTRNALLAILGWGADHPGGVFVRRREDAGQLFGLVTWVADGRGGVRQDIAMQVPICTHDGPLAEGCSVCGVAR